jgi:hypothetical protein
MKGRRSQLHGQRFVRLQPGNREPTLVAHQQIDLYLVAAKGVVIETAPDGQTPRRALHPDMRKRIDKCEQIEYGEKEIYAQSNSNDKENDQKKETSHTGSFLQPMSTALPRSSNSR